MYTPLLTFDFIDYMSTKDLSDKTLVEIGSGESTLYWEKKFKKVISYESNKDYYDLVSRNVQESSTEILFFDKRIFVDAAFKRNIKIADYIIIDNDQRVVPRVRFVKFAKIYKKESCSIVLDNGTWHIDAYQYLLDHFFVKDFAGLNKHQEHTVTTITEKSKELKYYRYTRVEGL